MKRRDVLITAVLLFVTCGLYWFYWNYRTTQDLKVATGHDELNPALELILSIVTCGLFGFYAEYRNAQLITQRMRQLRGSHEDKAVLILALDCIGLLTGLTWFIASLILQDECNRLSEALNTPQPAKLGSPSV